MNQRGPSVRLILSGVAVLITAAASLVAGTTTSGLVVRTLAGASGFYCLGAGVERALAWASEPLPGGNARAPETNKRGQKVNVLLPPASPESNDTRG